MLRFLYTKHATTRQINDALGMYAVADYFQAPCLSQRALANLESCLEVLFATRYWQSYRRQALMLLSGPYAQAAPGNLLVQVTARNVRAVLNDSGSVWDEIAQAEPDFAGRVLKACFPKPGSPGSEEPVQKSLKRPASRAFDDLQRDVGRW